MKFLIFPLDGPGLSIWTVSCVWLGCEGDGRGFVSASYSVSWNLINSCLTLHLGAEKKPQQWVARALLPDQVNLERAVALQSRADLYPAGTADSVMVAATVAGNPRLSPQSRSLQVWGSGSCGLTYKLSVAFG